MIEFHNDIALIKEDQCICRFVREENRLDHDQNLLPQVLKHINKGDIVIDCGAFIGDHTVAYAKHIGPTGTVLAFEPGAEAYECLKHNTKNEERVIIYNGGLGATHHKSFLKNVDTNSGMNYLSNQIEKRGESSFEEGNINIITIDSLNLPKLDFIKIDCEGYELEVLKGGIETIKKFKPKMLIEINDMTLERAGITRQAIYDFLKGLNYKFKNIYPQNGLDEYQMDIICFNYERFQ